MEIIQKPNLAALRPQLQQALDEGIRSVAVVLMHSSTYPDHEAEVGRVCKDMGFQHVSLSSQVMPMVSTRCRAAAVSSCCFDVHFLRVYNEVAIVMQMCERACLMLKMRCRLRLCHADRQRAWTRI